MKEQINFKSLKKVLSSKQMKNVLGGSGKYCWYRCLKPANAGYTNDCDAACSNWGGVDYCWCDD